MGQRHDDGVLAVNTPSAQTQEEPAAPIESGGAAVLSYQSPSRPQITRIVISSILLAIALSSIIFGVWLRRWAFEQSTGVHFLGDVRNGWRWGNSAIRFGLLDYYERNEA